MHWERGAIKEVMAAEGQSEHSRGAGWENECDSRRPGGVGD